MLQQSGISKEAEEAARMQISPRWDLVVGIGTRRAGWQFSGSQETWELGRRCWLCVSQPASGGNIAEALKSKVRRSWMAQLRESPFIFPLLFYSVQALKAQMRLWRGLSVFLQAPVHKLVPCRSSLTGTARHTVSPNIWVSFTHSDVHSVSHPGCLPLLLSSIICLILRDRVLFFAF